ncbi:hypothetical protein M527_13975 [Sphingobium indicum IP26]|nr:hypothetical protein M527_13975 [Sphingobium indicum IP26]
MLTMYGIKNCEQSVSHVEKMMLAAPAQEA